MNLLRIGVWEVWPFDHCARLQPKDDLNSYSILEKIPVEDKLASWRQIKAASNFACNMSSRSMKAVIHECGSVACLDKAMGSLCGMAVGVLDALTSVVLCSAPVASCLKVTRWDIRLSISR